jgi:predicted RNase H-like nuclease
MRDTASEHANSVPSLAGVDGCHAGWLVILAHPLARDAQEHQVMVCARFDEVLALLPTSTVSAVDIPIGLLAEQQPGGRDCDRCARRLLGRRASSVFTPPTRPLLDATHYAQVRGHGLSIQAFNILPKIREVDRIMTPALQQRVYEAHPELAFQTLAGHPLQDRKKTVAGREERLRVLDKIPSLLFHGIRTAFAHVLHTYKRADVAPDDILDAYVLVWTALRIWRAQAHCVPRIPPHDARGLRMEIWY